MNKILLLAICIATAGFSFAQDNAARDSILQQVLEQQLFPGTASAHQDGLKVAGARTLEFEAKDGTKLTGLLWKQRTSKRLIFYLHGSNGGASSWSRVVPLYRKLGYSVFIFDYRGYGKSSGRVAGEQEVYDDVEAAYGELLRQYADSSITIIGQSVGTAPATQLAAHHHPKRLVLQAPYFSLACWIHAEAPDFDTVNLKYRFDTWRYLQNVSSPVAVFHGTADKAIPVESSKKLRVYLKPGDRIYFLKGEGHNDFTKNRQYMAAIGQLLR